MIIRKSFKFEGAHIVRNCSTEKCKFSIHGHSYKVEFYLSASALDDGQMLVDFSIIKQLFNKFVDAFDHTTVLWSGDHEDYIDDMKSNSQRWIVLPVSPSAEQLSRVFFRLADYHMDRHTFGCGEAGDLEIYAVKVHETDTGYAMCYRADALNTRMGHIDLDCIETSPVLEGLLK